VERMVGSNHIVNDTGAARVAVIAAVLIPR
jgi:hypothetical protein